MRDLWRQKPPNAFLKGQAIPDQVATKGRAHSPYLIALHFDTHLADCYTWAGTEVAVPDGRLKGLAEVAVPSRARGTGG